MRDNKRQKIKRPDVRSLKIQLDIKANRICRTRVPVLKLTGVWLDKLGFSPEQRVIVTTMNKLLIITLDE